VDRTATGSSLQGIAEIYAYSCFLPSPLVLEEQTTYYISIYNTTSPTAASYWFWMMGNGPNYNFWYRASSTVSWVDATQMGDMAFELTTDGLDGQAIPEPVTCVLFAGSVLMGLGRLRRRIS
jgi:hypothetical protein